jgi:DNA-directed RNA polymerase subunit E'
MFSIVHMSDVVRIPPNRLTDSLKNTAIGILKEKYESMISPDIGYIIMIIDATANGIGKLLAGDGATYHKVNFKALTFFPKLKSDVKQGVIIANQSAKTLKIGSRIRARVTAISLGKGAAMGKIGITCRQPFLGASEWIEQEVKKANQPTTPSPVKEKKGGGK